MAPLLVVYVVGLALHGDGFEPFVDGWLGTMTQCVPALLCWVAAARVGFRRAEVVLGAAAVTSYSAGNAYYVTSLAGADSLPFPSPADYAYLMFYPLLLGALAMAVRRGTRRLASSVWLDCAVGSLGAASLLAVVLGSVVDSALAGSWSLATVVAVAYPLVDLFLVAAVAGIAVLRGVLVGYRWGPLIVGLLVFSGSDVIYALRVLDDTYAVGTPLDAGWAIGLTAIAVWVDGAARREVSEPRTSSPVAGATALVLTGLATVAGLGVLVLGTRARVPVLAVVLAGATLVVAAGRTQVAFRQLLRMADLRRDATTDHLTGLPNRRALYAQADARMVDGGDRPLALLLLDLDRFKEVNDSLGHHIGDQMLVQVGGRLSERLRPADLLVRLGGDEFAVLLDDVDPDEAAAAATALCETLAVPFCLEDIPVHSSVSIGIAVFPADGRDLGTLLRRADVAMYRAKATGTGHHAYGATEDTEISTRLRTLEELRTAMANDELVLHYQPQVQLGTGHVAGVEALVRWNHPTRGLLYPDAFLTLVEDAGLMRAMTRVVLEAALDQAARWRADGRHLHVAVNLSASSMIDASLPDEVSGMLGARGLTADALQLEITEEFLMADRDRARSILSRLRHSGVQIAIDDFGIGYSSLSYLRDLPIDELKLDRSFIRPMGEDSRAAALVASTIDLAHSLGLRMVAEGVETDVAYRELARLGCDLAQGYAIARPVPADELGAWLDARTAAGGTADLGRLPASAAID
ncbi:putative bifunctional diguanylate cyclase/phosphodiesterase [Oryzobacter telluris]|uniref:putative bifunctional diguanylate cyclase/phosphodiesterase n=1 Tax=Oryzobacter telluris TaxID=3149179 RepID=UPI00370DB5FF